MIYKRMVWVRVDQKNLNKLNRCLFNTRGNILLKSITIPIILYIITSKFILKFHRRYISTRFFSRGTGRSGRLVKNILLLSKNWLFPWIRMIRGFFFFLSLKQRGETSSNPVPVLLRRGHRISFDSFYSTYEGRGGEGELGISERRYESDRHKSILARVKSTHDGWWATIKPGARGIGSIRLKGQSSKLLLLLFDYLGAF